LSDIYTETLARAAEAQGSTQAVASLLHVPESTLLRWMSGRAQMPLQAFLKLVSILIQYEKTGGGYALTGTTAPGDKLAFRMGKLLARCARCDGTDFLPGDPTEPVTLTSELACCACGERVIHGNLIAQLATDAVNQSRAYTAARTRRQAQLLKMSTRRRALDSGG
jgi:transcriptional regulator with XRE-family HTH domain